MSAYFLKAICLNKPRKQKAYFVLLDKIKRDFGSYDSLKTQLVDSAAAQFGAGWIWLVENSDAQLGVLSTSNADNPRMWGMKPLLTIDVWEHAYYLGYQNARKTHVQAVVDQLLNWEAVATRLAGT